MKRLRSISRREFMLAALSSSAWPLVYSFAPPVFARTTGGGEISYSGFAHPAKEFRGTAMWGYDISRANAAQITREVDDLASRDFGGFLIVNDGASSAKLDAAYLKFAGQFMGFHQDGLEYLSREFFELYSSAVKTGAGRGMQFTLYSEYSYPTGTVAGQIYEQYPQHMAKRLDKVEQEVTGPTTGTLAIPRGTYIGAVLFNQETHERLDVSTGRKSESLFSCAVPQGRWKLMLFFLNHDAVLAIRNPGLIDYLDQEAMSVFLSLTYQKFYAHLGPYFGNVLQWAFWDEPSMHWLNGRMWTPLFNQGFEKERGYSPMRDYPALWYDIGPETASARNALYGYRAELFAVNFVKRVRDWCAEHGIQSSGHLDQEEVPNPVPINGDLMKAFEHQDIPGHDDIFFWGRANHGYKVVSSAAFNFDKPIVMAETYAAYNRNDRDLFFQVAMDQYAMGVSRQVTAAPQCPCPVELNEYIGRLSFMLQHGRHVADVAVLYPIAALQACYVFPEEPTPEQWQPDLSPADFVDPKAIIRIQGPAWWSAYNGGVLPPEIDYMDVGEVLFRGLRVDYTYLHPEVLERRCSIAGKTLVLNNEENREVFRILVIPGGQVLSAAAATKILEFHKQGGVVVATSRLPWLSAEAGKDSEVQRAISAIFGIGTGQLLRGDLPVDAAQGFYRAQQGAGKSYFLPKCSPGVLARVFEEVLPVRDVAFAEAMWPLKEGREYNGALTYIHKVRNGRQIYFFANSSQRPISTTVTLRGDVKLESWNPHTGLRGPAAGEGKRVAGEAATTVSLTLAPVSSVFYVEQA